MIAESTLTECRELAIEIAPELSQRPLYIVDARRFDGLPTLSGCLGWAQPGHFPDFEQRERIPGWDGPGPIIALDGDAIQDEYGPRYREGALQVMTHELAHVLPVSAVNMATVADGIHDTPQMRFAIRQHIEDKLSTPSPEPGSVGDHHGMAFVRRCCHLWARAKFAGVSVPINGIFGPDCAVRATAHAVTELVTEFDQMRSMTFAQIEATTPPTDFQAFWTESLDFYNKYFS